MNWTDYFMKMAELVASKSKDNSTKVGCVIVGPDREIVSTGFNGFARGVDETPAHRWERPAKYFRVEHAERNAIYNAARIGVSLKGCTAYMTAPPCAECMRGLIQAGIKACCWSLDHKFHKIPLWKESHTYALDMMKEAGIEWYEPN